MRWLHRYSRPPTEPRKINPKREEELARELARIRELSEKVTQQAKLAEDILIRRDIDDA